MLMHPRLATHLRSGQVSKVVYGSIIGLALVLALQAHPPGPVTVIATLLATAVAVALAELYSDMIGARAQASMGSATEPVATIAGDAGAVAFGIAFPAVFFAAAALRLIEDDTAYALAKWTGLGLIAGYAYLAARLSGIGPARALLEAVVVGLIAAVLIAIKALVH